MSTIDMDKERQLISTSSEYLSTLFKVHQQQHPKLELPKVLIICGSGLSGIARRLEAENPLPLTVTYESIPGFKKSTVPGHSGSLVFGTMNGTPVVLMNGRLHGYEGHTIYETVFPLRVINDMGTVKTVIVTNASGGLNSKYKPCDLMCIYDHINFPGLAGLHPLKGPNFDDIGPRFLPLSDAYDLKLRKLLFEKFNQLKLNENRKLHEGTYCFVSGPTFETRAESRMIRNSGADAVGMSTVPEVIVARHCGWRVLALSLITNSVVVDPPASALDKNPTPLDKGVASHGEVLENSRIASLDVEKLIAAVVEDL
ncbi:hypothetical protein KAFR_0L01430 [Kazachstania africana CBS 2517]|uniref:Purine nucleoside phosphorylase n=1 Tax=Kazachstania africana (strain ATCC 22294 / BCRC 22015 / CBS 2517 / CECT 1963 / NBRC 1671 / NRRL Y-8276) TaxID=1071382 RepID=H2B2A2_KAZAF|nr:hypothetical protein KAFR_0L01430 [Kazachstania africana CBS 2517]CCF60752.1 hypothetical protein KAFR_0L01430 [Kazachstania africana CBS 2517]